jgi:hypothetical protein
MLLKLFEFLGLRNSPKEETEWAAICARNEVFLDIADEIGKEAIHKHEQLRADNIPLDDPRWVLEVSPDIMESAQRIGIERFVGLRLVPTIDGGEK